MTFDVAFVLSHIKEKRTPGCVVQCYLWWFSTKGEKWFSYCIDGEIYFSGV